MKNDSVWVVAVAENQDFRLPKDDTKFVFYAVCELKQTAERLFNSFPHFDKTYRFIKKMERSSSLSTLDIIKPNKLDILNLEKEKKIKELEDLIVAAGFSEKEATDWLGLIQHN